MGLVWNLDETPLHMEDYRCDGSSMELKDAEIFPTVIHGGALILQPGSMHFHVVFMIINNLIWKQGATIAYPWPMHLSYAINLHTKDQCTFIVKEKGEGWQVDVITSSIN